MKNVKRTEPDARVSGENHELRALLKEEYARQFDGEGQTCCASDGNGDDTGCQPISGDTGWRFCDSKDCDVVYFSEEGDTNFTKSQLKVPVGVKEAAGKRQIGRAAGRERG